MRGYVILQHRLIHLNKIWVVCMYVCMYVCVERGGEGGVTVRGYVILQHRVVHLVWDILSGGVI